MFFRKHKRNSSGVFSHNWLPCKHTHIHAHTHMQTHADAHAHADADVDANACRRDTDANTHTHTAVALVTQREGGGWQEGESVFTFVVCVFGHHIYHIYIY